MRMPYSITLPPIFTIGEIFQLDNKDGAFIRKIRGKTSSYWFTVRYVIGNKQ